MPDFVYTMLQHFLHPQVLAAFVGRIGVAASSATKDRRQDSSNWEGALAHIIWSQILAPKHTHSVGLGVAILLAVIDFRLLDTRILLEFETCQQPQGSWGSGS